MRERVRGSLKARVAWMGRFSRGEEVVPEPPASPGTESQGTAKRSGMRATPAAIAKIKQELVDLEVEVGEPERRKSG